MLISHERLNQLKEQLDYLEQAYQFAYDRNALRLGKHGAKAEELNELAIAETETEFKLAGLDVAMNRIRLEIDFLTDYFK